MFCNEEDGLAIRRVQTGLVPGRELQFGNDAAEWLRATVGRSDTATNYPKTTLWHEAGVPPADLLLQQISERNANRWARLDVQHPITRSLTSDEYGIQQQNNPEATHRRTMAFVRLFRIANTAIQQERPRLLPLRFSAAIFSEGAQDWPDEEEGARRMRAWLADNPAGPIVFSDGSKTEQDTTGFGFAVFRNGQLIDSGKTQRGKREVFDAEVTGALQDLRSAISHRQPHEKITICIDNTLVIDGIGSTAPMSSQADFRTIQKTGDLHPGMIAVRWCPGHSGIHGNSWKCDSSSVPIILCVSVDLYTCGLSQTA